MSLFEDPKYEALFRSVAEVKAQRASFLDELATGSVALHQVFERAEVEPVLAAMKVLPAIEALPESGKVSTRRAFGDLGIDEAGLIGDVSAEQIDRLGAAIESHTR